MSKFVQVNEGNSNIILKKGNDAEHVFRLCKRYNSLELINEYIGKNVEFHKQIRAHYDLLNDLLPPDELIIVKKIKNSEDFSSLAFFLLKKDITVDDDYIVLVKLPNCLPANIFDVNVVDHYSKIYNGVLLECKPKWNQMTFNDFKIYANYTNFTSNRDSGILFCRNCSKASENTEKPFNFCFNGCKGKFLLPKDHLMNKYLGSSENVIAKIYKLQNSLQQSIIKNSGSCTFLINMLTALRDVTLFIDLESNHVNLIDLDYKNIEHRKDFVIKMKKEWKYIEAADNNTIYR